MTFPDPARVVALWLVWMTASAMLFGGLARLRWRRPDIIPETAGSRHADASRHRDDALPDGFAGR